MGHRRAVDEAGGVSGNEYKELRGVAEAVVAWRQQADNVVRDVIKKDHPLPDAPHQIEPQVALGRPYETIVIMISHAILPHPLRRVRVTCVRQTSSKQSSTWAPDRFS